MIRLALAATLLLCLPLARRWGRALSLRLERRRYLREREAARAAWGSRPQLDRYACCAECGGPLPYGGHVATPLCDCCLVRRAYCLDRTAAPRPLPALLAALSDLRAEAQAGGHHDLAAWVHSGLTVAARRQSMREEVH